MKVGIFTPVHKVNYEHLDALAESIFQQTYQKFIWHILLNGEAIQFQQEIFDRYKDHINISTEVTEIVNNIGALKKEACDYLSYCDILLEVDYDDLLHKDCLKELVNAALTTEAVFFFSNFAHFGTNKAGEFESFTYGEYYGWESKPHKNEDLFGDNILNETICFPATAQYMYRIESSPNHLRAWKSEPYRRINGHDNTLEVGDDHDLMMRFYKEYGEEGFHHIDKCLYYQRYDRTTTTHSRNADIQLQVDKNYLNHSEDIFKRWANDNDLLCVDLGGRFNCPEGYKSVDLQDADYTGDLNGNWSEISPRIEANKQESINALFDKIKLNKAHEELDFELDDEITKRSKVRYIDTDSVGVIRAYHVLEHLDDPIHFFNEAYRVLAPGGFLLIEVPSARDYHAFADPTHKSFWTELNFEYYCKEYKAKFIRPQYKGAFQIIRMKEYAWSDGTLCISAQLIALKGEYNYNHWGVKETDENYIQ